MYIIYVDQFQFPALPSHFPLPNPHSTIKYYFCWFSPLIVIVTCMHTHKYIYNLQIPLNVVPMYMFLELTTWYWITIRGLGKADFPFFSGH